MKIKFSDQYGNDVTYEIEDTELGHAFERLLPQTVWMNKTGSSQFSFTPAKKLSVFGAKEAAGGKEAICYHKPWNEIILFYGGYQPDEGLYQLGVPVKGQGAVRNLKGPILIEELL